VGLAILSAPAQAPKAPDSKGNPAKKDSPAPIYNEKADAEANLQGAIALAKRENRRVLVQWGANWCPWCHRLHKVFKEDQGLAKILLYEYDLVLVDIGRRDKNMELPVRYGVDLKKSGIPFLTVLDGDGRVVANQPTEPFEQIAGDKKGYDVAKVAAFLKEHQAKAPDAEPVFSAALEAAGRTGRKVFPHFGAPWCGWCRRLDAWLLRPEVTPVLAKDFVEVKIDLDRMPGAKRILERYNPGSRGGIPWFAFIDAKGKAIITSDGPKGNTGFPSEPYEIEHFVKMLQASRQRLTDADMAQLRKSLEQLAQERQASAH
jgi:thiol-disulfide isomerase/thioredoxin